MKAQSNIHLRLTAPGTQYWAAPRPVMIVGISLSGLIFSAATSQLAQCYIAIDGQTFNASFDETTLIFIEIETSAAANEIARESKFVPLARRVEAGQRIGLVMASTGGVTDARCEASVYLI